VRDIQSFMLVFGLLSSVFDLVTFGLLRGVLHADERTFQTCWFVVSVLTELGALLVLRTRKRAWVSRPGRWLVWLSVLVAVIVLGAPFVPWLAAPLGLQPLTGLVAMSIFAIVAGYVASTEAAKAVYYRVRTATKTTGEARAQVRR
jgi:Mg2+-importing ATPase